MYKALKIRSINLQSELKELQHKLRGAYTNDSRLLCGFGPNQHVFLSRNEGLEISLMIEIIDLNVITSPVPKAKK